MIDEFNLLAKYGLFCRENRMTYQPSVGMPFFGFLQILFGFIHIFGRLSIIGTFKPPFAILISRRKKCLSWPEQPGKLS